MFILQPKMKESTKIKQAKEKYLETKDAQEALRTIPRFMHIERAILEVQAAKGRENDFCGQLTAIPSKMKRMYINAYQSYLWNKVASERVRKFGINTVVEGDLGRHHRRRRQRENSGRDSKTFGRSL